MNTASAQSVKQVLSAVSGFAYNIELYSGKQDNSLTEAETDCGASSNVVTRLVRNIPDGANYKLYFDNYFNSPELQLSLATRGISSHADDTPMHFSLSVMKMVQPKSVSFK